MATIEVLIRSELESKVLQVPGPVALDFYQASGAPCRALEPRLERVARQYAGRLSVYRVDIDRDLAVSESLLISHVVSGRQKKHLKAITPLRRSGHPRKDVHFPQKGIQCGRGLAKEHSLSVDWPRAYQVPPCNLLIHFPLS